jgi:FkbM family methyltransferase
MKFLFKYPSRGRPDWFRDTLAAYYGKLSGKHEYQFVITLDADDASMNTAPMRNWLNAQNNLSYHYGTHRSKIEACNADVPEDGWDILVLVSDDMTPLVQDFDDVIAQDMQRQFPGLDGALHYNDGVAQKLIRLSIMGRKLYERLGWVYYPAYQGQWCDNEFTDITRLWERYWYTDQMIIRHDHQKHGYDDIYRKGEASFHADREIYEWRKAKGFPLAFSQNDEDSVIRRYFNDKMHGRFLDIGAGDGITFSNTKLLYDMGWGGVAVEPSPNLMQVLRENFPPDRVKHVQAALTDKDGPVEFYHSPDFISTLNEAHKAKWQDKANYTKIGVDGICWQTLMARHGTDFDFLNLDIEGENIRMLRLIPQEYLVRLKLACIEYDGNIGAVKAVMEPFGFQAIHVTGENVILGK